MISFNVPPCAPKSLQYVKKAIENHQICGDGEFTQRCSQWLKMNCKVPNVFLTTSCTHALEMAALLCNISPEDEIIMPSYTFVSTADAFVLRGAKIVFVDIRPDTMNIDEKLIEDAITEKTKAIVPVHYAGVACEMDEINRIAKKHGPVSYTHLRPNLAASFREQWLRAVCTRLPHRPRTRGDRL